MSILKNCLQSSLALYLFAASAASGQTAAFTPGSREIFAIDFASVPVGALPQNVKVLWGKASIVDKDGTHMVRATEPTEVPPYFWTISAIKAPNFTGRG